MQHRNNGKPVNIFEITLYVLIRRAAVVPLLPFSRIPVLGGKQFAYPVHISDRF